MIGLEELIKILMFFISVTVSITLILKGVNVALAISSAFILYSIPILKLSTLDVIVQTININTLNVLLSFIFALILAELYRNLKISEEVVKALEKLSPILASTLIPAVVGLLPMPAGAYVSATMVDPVYNFIGLEPEKKTFINFWFRHIWITTWPLYQSVLIASAILGKSITEIIKHTWVIMLAMIIAGMLMIRRMFYGKKLVNRVEGSYRGLVHLWPFLTLALLTLATPIPLPAAVAITIMIMVIVYMPNTRSVGKALGRALDPTLIILILTALMFSNAIKSSGLAETIAKTLHNYATLAVTIIPLIMVISTGIEFTYSALGFPPILFLISDKNLPLAFLGGAVGSILAPTHACLVLSAKYFKAQLKKVYRYMVPATSITIAISIPIITIQYLIT